ncbi:MAG: hypothetical protein J1E43_03865 [Christensenellaceae bacterium]|nr:hypothetical protein [Christensenellaceae bacterium]
MSGRLLCLLSLLCLLALPARAEEPLTLPQCQTVEQVEALVLYPTDDMQPVGVERGLIRYISQDTRKPGFCADYWLGGEPGSELDLTLEEGPFRRPYQYYARNMCTRAVYAMALSYLGIDLTPGGMSAMTQKRVVDAPYDETTDLLPEFERVTFSADVFQQMYEAYQSDPNCSPVYLYFRRPSGSTHAVLVVARREDGRYIVIDPKYREANGRPIHVYTISLNKYGQKITGSDFRSEQYGSTVLGCFQWRLTEKE